MQGVQYSYNQEPNFPQGMMPSRGMWQHGVGDAIGYIKNLYPNWVTQYGVVAYILALVVVSFMYSAYSMPWYYMLSGTVAVIAFFFYGSNVVRNTAVSKIHREKSFEQKIFIIAIVPRLLWMILIYSIFMQNYGDTFGFENGDALFYDDLGKSFANDLRNGGIAMAWKNVQGGLDLSDTGYASYVGIIYWLTGNSIIVVRLLKCVWSSLTVLLIYRLAKRNFDIQIARVVAVFCALWPNFWYYSGTHLKETEMVLLAVLFVEQADQMLRSRQFTAWKVIPVLLIATALFTLRTPLGLVAILSLIFSIVMSSSKVVNWGKRIIVGFLAILLVGVIAGNQLEEKARGLLDNRTAQQEEGFNWYATRKNGNALAKHAGTAVFAPMIFTLPFPSIVRPFDGQDQQQLLNGGNFTKNIISGFTILAMVMLLMSGKWREHLLPLSFMLGYLAVLAMSSFAHSERFHQPAMPFEFMFAAYGLSIAVTNKKYKRWFTYWCGLMFVACIAWNWFKMAGRGMA